MPAKYVVSGSGEGDILNLPQAAGIKVDKDDQELKYAGTDGTIRRVKGTSQASARELLVFTASDTPALVAANTSAEEAMTFTGILTTDIPVEIVGPGVQPAGLSMGGIRISAADTLQVRFGNHTAAGITPAAGTYTLVVLR